MKFPLWILGLLWGAGLALGDESPHARGAVRLGPALAAGFPHPVSYGLDGLYGEEWGFGFETGKFTKAVDGATFQMAHWDLRARYFLNPEIFVGAAFGRQSVFAKGETELALKSGNLATKAEATVEVSGDTTYLAPYCGWQGVWESGLTLGFDLGAQIPLAAKTTTAAGVDGATPSQAASLKKSDDYRDLAGKMTRRNKLLSKGVLPYVTLLRVGWMF